MPIYKSLVVTLHSVVKAHCEYCCYETPSSFKAAGNSNANRTLSSSAQVHREKHWLSSKANFYTTLLSVAKTFNTVPTKIAQRSLKKKSFWGRGGRKETGKEHYTNSSLLLINRIVLT